MYQAYSEETAHAINGVSGRLYARHVRPDAPHLFSAQKWISEGRAFPRGGYGPSAKLHAEIRFDDNWKNGHARFSITAEVSGAARAMDNGSIGCHHDAIAKRFPELAHLIKWHLCSTVEPMHYVANACFHASDRDHNGLLKGETRQIINGRTKLPCWTLEAVQADGVAVSDTETGRKYIGAPTIPLYLVTNSFDALEGDLPPVPELRWVPMVRVGEGKARDFDAARSAAIWPNATDAELSVPRAELEAKLIERRPMLMGVFRAAMGEAGLLWEPQP